MITSTIAAPTYADGVTPSEPIRKAVMLVAASGASRIHTDPGARDRAFAAVSGDLIMIVRDFNQPLTGDSAGGEPVVD